MSEEEIISIIIDEGLYIHRQIGPGMLENVYKTCLAHRLQKRGLIVEIEKPVPVLFEEIRMSCGYRIDLLVNNKIIVETKSIDAIIDIHIAQLLTYLRFAGLRHGLLLNFKNTLFKHGIRRVTNGFN